MVYSAATISGAMGGFIAYGIEMNHDLSLETSGREPWRWLFIIEGCVGILVGLLFYAFLPRFPDKLRDKGNKGSKHWLFTKEEIDVACERTSSHNTMGARVDLRQVLIALTSPVSWGFAIINGGVFAGIATTGVFLPTFVKELGYSRGEHPPSGGFIHHTRLLINARHGSQRPALQCHPLRRGFCLHSRRQPRVGPLQQQRRPPGVLPVHEHHRPHRHHDRGAHRRQDRGAVSLRCRHLPLSDAALGLVRLQYRRLHEEGHDLGHGRDRRTVSVHYGHQDL